MSAQQTFEAVVVGGGMAGMVTAVRLAEAGVRVGVLEKGTDERYPCNARMSGGAFHVAFRDVLEDPAVLLEAINTRTRGFASPVFAQAMAEEIGNAVRWLKDKGVRFIKVGHDPHRQHTLAPPIATRGRNYWQGRGGDVLLRTLGSALCDAGGTLVLGTRAVRLRMEAGRCAGVEVERGGEPGFVAAPNVVICDGGFQANHELMRRYVSPAPEKVKQRGAATGNGDGLRMALEVGAKAVGMDRIYGHVLAQEAMDNDDLWPFPLVDFLCTSGIVVDRAARRFVDEGLGGVYITNRLVALDDPLAGTVIFDQAIWDGPGREFISPANPLLVSGGATIHEAPDLATLAQQLGLPAETLEVTVAQYNAAVDAGNTAALQPARTAGAHKPHPIRKPPYRAVRLSAGITYTMGGLAIDAASRVLDEHDRPIPGLYSAGCATGGLEGGELAGYVGGLTKSAVTGYRAANAIAAERRGG